MKTVTSLFFEVFLINIYLTVFSCVHRKNLAINPKKPTGFEFFFKKNRFLNPALSNAKNNKVSK